MPFDAELVKVLSSSSAAVLLFLVFCLCIWGAIKLASSLKEMNEGARKDFTSITEGFRTEVAGFRAEVGEARRTCSEHTAALTEQIFQENEKNRDVIHKLMDNVQDVVRSVAELVSRSK